MLANASGCRIFSVAYRLAPEHQYPAGIEDAYYATRWLCEHAREVYIDPARVAVGGDSIRRHARPWSCASGAKQDFRAPVLKALQVLICPVTDLGGRSASWEEYGQGYFMERVTLDWAVENYAPTMDRTDWRISPLRAPDFAGLPPAHLHTAEFDPFRDEGRAYARCPRARRA